MILDKKSKIKKLKLIQCEIDCCNIQLEHITKGVQDLKDQYISLKTKQQKYMTRIRTLEKQLEKWS